MPELPEVETTVNQLKKKILKRKIVDIWCDNPKMVKKVVGGKTINATLGEFKENIVRKEIKNIKRRGKNILIEFDGDIILLIHQKLTGHLLVSKWQIKNSRWQSIVKGPLDERINKYIHLVLWLDNEQMLVLSDLRKFAKIIYGKRKSLLSLPEIQNLGPEPLKSGFTFEKFKNILSKSKGKIKQVLMNQGVLTGIGNIYSDEILWQAKINPFRESQKLTEEELKRIYLQTKEILKKAIKLQGESISDWRDTEGKKGGYDKVRKVYRREGEKCLRCGTKIERKKIGGRSAHFCPTCQLL